MAKLSQEAVDDFLHIIAVFDRERGVPHNYHDLEKMFKTMIVEVKEDEVFVTSPKPEYKNV